MEKKIPRFKIKVVQTFLIRTCPIIFRDQEILNINVNIKCKYVNIKKKAVGPHCIKSRVWIIGS